MFSNDFLRAFMDVGSQTILILGTIIGLTLLTLWCAQISVDYIRGGKRLLKKDTSKKRFRNRHGLWKKSPSQEETSQWFGSYFQGMSNEFFGAVITTIFLGLGVLVLDQYQDIQNRKAELILQMGSPDNATAIEAVRQLRVEGWLEDGTLRGADLQGANLQEADLQHANLQEVNLWEANLQGANLEGVSLERANLSSSDLQRTDLRNADLQGASLNESNLQGANLRGANLSEVNFLGLLRQVDQGLGNTDSYHPLLNLVILPDGSYWDNKADINRFIDLTHPDFWDPCIELDLTEIELNYLCARG